jgi:transcriptional regulator with XRE-family HTH domain
MKVKLSLGEKLRDLRDERKLTLSALSDAVNIPIATLQRMESDEDIRTGYQDIAALAKFYDVSTDYLFGVTDNRKHRNTAVDALRLSDTAIEALTGGKMNNRLISELLSHPEFPNLLNSVEVYVDRKVLPQIANMNMIYKLTEDKIKADFAVDDKDEYIRQLQELVVDEDEYLRYRISERFNALMKDLFAAHKKDELSKEQEQTLREMKENLDAYSLSMDSREAGRRKAAILAKQIGLNLSTLTDEEIIILVKALEKSDKFKQARRKRR